MSSEASTFFSSSTMVGRIYGQWPKDEHLFDAHPLLGGGYGILIRPRSIEEPSTLMPRGATLLVQLFERPDTLWLASVAVISGEVMLPFVPVALPDILDGRSEPPRLADVTEEQEAEGVADRERSQNTPEA